LRVLRGSFRLRLLLLGCRLGDDHLVDRSSDYLGSQNWGLGVKEGGYVILVDHGGWDYERLRQLMVGERRHGGQKLQRMILGKLG